MKHEGVQVFRHTHYKNECIIHCYGRVKIGFNWHDSVTYRAIKDGKFYTVTSQEFREVFEYVRG